MLNEDYTAIGIAQAASNLAQIGAAAGESKAQRKWQEKMANIAWERQQQAWNMQNEYNTPTAQKQRLMDAGLNPLLFGMDNSGQAEAFSSPQANSYQRASFESMPNPVTSAMSAALQQAQIHNIQADTAKKSEETLSEVAHREKLINETNQIKQQISNLMINEHLTEEQIDQLRIINKWNDKIQDMTYQERLANIHLTESQAYRINMLLEGELDIQNLEIKDFEYRWNKVVAEVKNILANTKLTEKDIENYLINHMDSGVWGSGLSATNLIRALLDKLKRGNESSNNDGDGSPVLSPENWQAANKWPNGN